MTFQPSPFQSAFFSELTSGTSSIILNAVAGSGKTTTIVHATSLLPSSVLTVFLAFNKRIAEELEKRVPRHIQVGTFHSRGFRALSRSLPKTPKLNKDKIRDILKAATKTKKLPWEEYEKYSQVIVKLVSLAKSAGLGAILPNQPNEWEKLVDHFCITLDSGGNIERAIQIAMHVLEESNDDVKTIDYDDMLYLALLRNVTFDKATFLFVDEFQDTNEVQLGLIPKMLAPNGRLIVVGDPAQGIYGFRGAGNSTMERAKELFSMKELPLSICYRCSKSVILEAQKYLS